MVALLLNLHFLLLAMTPKMPLTLWGSSLSSSTNRIRLALALKKVPYTLMSPGAPEQMASEEYRKSTNPLNQMPTLQIGETTKICQSVAILEYLEEAYPEVKLMPDDILTKAKMREVVEIVNSFIQPMQSTGPVKDMAKTDKALAAFLPAVFPDPKTGTIMEWNEGDPGLLPQKYMHRGFSAIEGILTTTSGKFCFGDSPTLADCFLVPQLINAKRYKLEIEKYPMITKVYQNILAEKVLEEVLSDTLRFVR